MGIWFKDHFLGACSCTMPCNLAKSSGKLLTTIWLPVGWYLLRSLVGFHCLITQSVVAQQALELWLYCLRSTNKSPNLIPRPRPPKFSTSMLLLLKKSSSSLVSVSLTAMTSLRRSLGLQERYETGREQQQLSNLPQYIDMLYAFINFISRRLQQQLNGAFQEILPFFSQNNDKKMKNRIKICKRRVQMDLSGNCFDYLSYQSYPYIIVLAVVSYLFNRLVISESISSSAPLPAKTLSILLALFNYLVLHLLPASHSLPKLPLKIHQVLQYQRLLNHTHTQLACSLLSSSQRLELSPCLISQTRWILHAKSCGVCVRKKRIELILMRCLQVLIRDRRGLRQRVINWCKVRDTLRQK